MSARDATHDEQLTRESRLTGVTGLMPLSSLIALFISGLFVYWLFHGDLYRFYASFVFLFYSWTNSMWISVVMLGVFQTILMIPLRIVRIFRADSLKELLEDISAIKHPGQQQSAVKQKFSLGNADFLFYLVDFMIQLTTFLTIGRLFLTDFYSKPLDPSKLYDFVSYPAYPIQDRFFQIPYPVITQTMDLGFNIVVLVWLAIFMFQVLLWVGRLFGQYAKGMSAKPSAAVLRAKTLSKYSIGYFIFVFLISWLVLTHVPTGLGIRIFSGDVAFQNSTFNTVTAIATFLTLLWFDVNKIARKKAKAREAGIEEYLVAAMGRKMFREGFFTAGVVGLGAYYITNQIPCAFELSIFTLEIISLLAPVTMDKWIQNLAKPKEPEAETPPPVEPPAAPPAPPAEPPAQKPPANFWEWLVAGFSH
jgi:hypothetical protein